MGNIYTSARAPVHPLKCIYSPPFAHRPKGVLIILTRAWSGITKNTFVLQLGDPTNTGTLRSMSHHCRSCWILSSPMNQTASQVHQKTSFILSGKPGCSNLWRWRFRRHDWLIRWSLPSFLSVHNYRRSIVSSSGVYYGLFIHFWKFCNFDKTLWFWFWNLDIEINIA